MDICTRIHILENILRMNSMTSLVVEAYQNKDDVHSHEQFLSGVALQLDRYLIITRGFRILDKYLGSFVRSKNSKFRKLIRDVREVLGILQSMEFELSDFDGVQIPESKEEYMSALRHYLALDQHPEVMGDVLPRLREIEIQYNRLVGSIYNKNL